MNFAKSVKVKYSASAAGSVGTGESGCRAASSATIRGDADPTWWTCSSAFGNPARNSRDTVMAGILAALRSACRKLTIICQEWPVRSPAGVRARASGTIHCVSERFDFTGDELAPAYRAAVDAIEAGDLVVLPTDTVYGIAADAFKADAVQRLLDAKGRGRDMPPPVLISVVESLDALATDVPEAGRKLCEEFWPGPLTVICHAQTSLMWDLGETQGTVALRVPDHENTRELLSRTGPLAVSSANLSGQPAALDVYDAEAQLHDSVAVYLDGGAVDRRRAVDHRRHHRRHAARRPHRRSVPGPAPRAVVPEVTSDDDVSSDDDEQAGRQAGRGRKAGRQAGRGRKAGRAAG